MITVGSYVIPVPIFKLPALSRMLNPVSYTHLDVYKRQIPDCSDLNISPDADYVYICENNTIYGTKFHTLPNTKGKLLVSDVSSCFLSEPVDVDVYKRQGRDRLQDLL